jgi:acyl dehydratase
VSGGTSPRVGDQLPALALPPLSRATLALYAGGSGDHVPLHIDSAFAREAGHPDVIMHGMLGLAWVCRMLTAWAPQEALRDLQVRFTAITYPGEELVACGRIAEVGVDGVPARCRVDVTLENRSGERKLAGHAVIDLAAGS